jgi:hypothetical protein
MARHRCIDTSARVLPVDLARQLLPGTSEHAQMRRAVRAVCRR